ncbi:NosD domain-containing protein [Fervidibacter sacchari]|jgi:parallel beta-helix repeat protein|uniref:Parallel beta-helix repeat protein n=1 Tax=Candidatus Fervidibacter sacchari TaxID=1448929 RepID=A0ABT2EQQ2_9BACT|nr:NosD domain-containing protein [Candidatus Fervidibacter sacchari]MCS3920285.1 parallel beta-helix repeat protein [Candidatus Fervidibacter sacchari]WKU14750.1 NosD domain-containing protein [Candidatus Fervidibacter sacchari]
MKWLRSSGIFAVAVLLLALSSVQVMALTHCVRVRPPLPPNNCGVNHRSIQEAINHASDGDEILVGPGIYSERIIVNKNELVIHSQRGRHLTIIRPPELVPAGVHITGDDNAFMGFTVEDRTLNGGRHPHAHRLIFVQGDRNFIADNILRGRGVTSYADVGILVRGGGVGNGVAEDNTIESNEVFNVVNGILSVSVSLTNAAEGTWVFSNYVHGCNQGIYIDRSPDCWVDGNVAVNNGLGVAVRSSAWTFLTRNIVSNNTVGALFVACNYVTVGDEFDPNDFTANDIGILVTDENGNTGTPTINYNNIEGNGVGLQNGSSQQVNAENNWWGDPGGPGADEDEDGIYGDTVEGDVDYDPWRNARLPYGG